MIVCELFHEVFPGGLVSSSVNCLLQEETALLKNWTNNRFSIIGSNFTSFGSKSTINLRALLGERMDFVQRYTFSTVIKWWLDQYNSKGWSNSLQRSIEEFYIAKSDARSNPSIIFFFLLLSKLFALLTTEKLSCNDTKLNYGGISTSPGK